ncbi:MAG: hypothetical protein ACREOZ_00675 [Gloeomargaritales cyanobacterium]
MDIMDMMHEFHSKLDPITNPQLLMTAERRRLREDLLTQELEEYLDSSQDKDIIRMADALGDIVYVCFGTAYSMGIDFNAVIAEIHRSNMTKEQGPTGKAVKGKNYSPPNLKRIIHD